MMKGEQRPNNDDHFDRPLQKIFKKLSKQASRRQQPAYAGKIMTSGAVLRNTGKESQRSRVRQKESSNARLKSLDYKKKKKSATKTAKKGHRRIVSNDFLTSANVKDMLKIRPETGSNDATVINSTAKIYSKPKYQSKQGLIQNQGDKGSSSNLTMTNSKNDCQRLSQNNVIATSSINNAKKSSKKRVRTKHRRAQSNLLENFVRLIPRGEIKDKREKIQLKLKSNNYNVRLKETVRLKEIRQKFKELSFKKDSIKSTNTSFEELRQQTGNTVTTGGGTISKQNKKSTSNLREKSGGLVKGSKISHQNYLMMNVTKDKPIRNKEGGGKISGTGVSKFKKSRGKHRRVYSNDLLHNANLRKKIKEDFPRQVPQPKEVSKLLKARVQTKKQASPVQEPKKKKRVRGVSKSSSKADFMKMIRAKSWKVDINNNNATSSMRKKSKTQKAAKGKVPVVIETPRDSYKKKKVGSYANKQSFPNNTTKNVKSNEISEARKKWMQKKKRNGKGHRKNALSMPIADPTNQLITQLGMPIHLSNKKGMTMTPDITNQNSPNISPRRMEEIEHNSSLVSLMMVNEELEHNEDNFSGHIEIPLPSKGLKSSTQNSARDHVLQITMRSDQRSSFLGNENPTNISSSKQSRTHKKIRRIFNGSERASSKKLDTSSHNLSSSQKLQLRFASRKNSFKLQAKFQNNSSRKKSDPKQLSNHSSKQSRKHHNKSKPYKAGSSQVSHKSPMFSHRQYDKQNPSENTKQLIKRKVISGDVSRAISNSKQRRNMKDVTMEMRESVNPKKQFKASIDFNKLSLKNTKSAPLILQKLILQNKIREGVKLGEEQIVTNLDFYQFNKLLGEGSFGKVYSAVSILCEKEVAIKCFDKARLKSEAAKRKIFQEVRILKMLDHKNITSLLEVFENKKYFFFVMDYAEEGDILQLLKEKGPLTEDFARYLVIQVIEGLKHCHKRGVLHRDIKLDNVLLASDYVAKVCDFGVSCILKKGQVLYEQCGTPAYIAPEVISGDGYSSFQPDLWNMGIMLYAMVTGTVPFKSNNIEELHALILKGEFIFPKNSKLSPSLQDFLRKVIVLDPSTRITLEGMLEHEWIEAGLNKQLFETMIQSMPLPHKEVVKRILKLGFSREMVSETLDKKILNHISACYQLLKYEQSEALSKKINYNFFPKQEGKCRNCQLVIFPEFNKDGRILSYCQYVVQFEYYQFLNYLS